jgi:hypothetical protein
MKLIIRSVIASLFLIAFAFPALAQSRIAVKINPPSGNCFLVVIKSLPTAPLTATSALLNVYDQNTCKKVCDGKIGLNKSLQPCELFRFKICCQSPLPAKYIAYVKIFYSVGGSSEGWLWN